MSQYAPSQNEDPQYASAYPAPPNSQLLDGAQQQQQQQQQQHQQQQQQQQQLQYTPQNIYPKIENLDLLQQQAQHASHALSGQPSHAHAHSADQTPKPNRLRKACDSCSIRKVKVSLRAVCTKEWIPNGRDGAIGMSQTSENYSCVAEGTLSELERGLDDLLYG
jgi:hypothetical protein